MSEPRFKVGDWVRVVHCPMKGFIGEVGEVTQNEFGGPDANMVRIAGRPEGQCDYIFVDDQLRPTPPPETVHSQGHTHGVDPWLRDEHGEAHCPKCKHYVSLHAFGGCFHEGCPCGEIAWPEPEKIAT